MNNEKSKGIFSLESTKELADAMHNLSAMVIKKETLAVSDVGKLCQDAGLRLDICVSLISSLKIQLAETEFYVCKLCGKDCSETPTDIIHTSGVIDEEFSGNISVCKPCYWEQKPPDHDFGKSYTVNKTD